ncbi:MAG: EamA family transporter [Chloroflexi bacterium]|nr:EamA family transporter [Chloroflexota bacterium]
MGHWLPYAFATALALATADFLVKSAVGKLSNSVALLLYGICTFLIGLSWVLWQRAHGTAQYAQPAGILAAIGVGIVFSFVTLGLYATFGAGAPISVASPAIRLGGLVLVSLVGLTFLREPLTWRYVIGMLMACGGIYLIVTR